MPTKLLNDETLTIEPPPDSLMAGMAARVPEERALGVHIHHPVPFLGRCLLHVAAQVYPGVVHQHVQLAEPGHCLADCALPVGLAGDIQPYEDGPRARRRDFRGNVAALLLQDVAEHDACSLAGEQPRLDRTHPPGSAADQRHLAVKPQWAVIPPSTLSTEPVTKDDSSDAR